MQPNFMDEFTHNSLRKEWMYLSQLFNLINTYTNVRYTVLIIEKRTAWTTKVHTLAPQYVHLLGTNQ